ncbi:phage minor capsid protein [Carboxydocella sp. JDF658]|uniref:phage minor capsid protein n=1 Tax=Carboxydocella sp. JDF658 TaxID=1926600 RepID=UPI0009ACF376|nr:phage minor capsid protein [Carboxydocella sp. JDF658]
MSMHDSFQFIGRRIDDQFRRVALEEAGRKMASGTTIKDMKQRVIQRLLDQGQTAFVDKLGRKWRLDSYAEMVARTTTREAASAATINTCREAGLDLVKITTHYPTCEKCAPLQGKVFSISGQDKRYPKLTDEYRPPIHPNCRHSLHPYVRELDPDAEKVQKYSNTSLTEDPRNEREKQAYKEMRDAVTIATNRKRAREALYNEVAPLEDKLKAARQLQRSYEKAGQKPRGQDAAILKHYQDWLKENARFGIITPENAHIPENKLLGYALNIEHAKGGRDKAIAFEKALGYNKSNYRQLIEDVKANLSKYPAVYKGNTKYGDKYEVRMELTGPNGKTAPVITGWLIEKETGRPRLTTIYVDKR